MSRPTPLALGDVPFALHAASAVLAARAGVSVIGVWTSIKTATGTRWGLPVRLNLTGAPPSEHVPAATAWTVTVDPDEDVRLYPSGGAGGLTATFPHQNHNRAARRGEGVRSGDLCTATATHKLARARVALYDEPAGLYERVLWHVDRALEWLRDAAAGTLTQAGDPYELPDFRTRGHRPGALATIEDSRTLAAWQAAPRVGLAEVAAVGHPAHGALAVRAWLDGSRDDVLRPPWGLHVSGLDARVRAVWVRLDAVPVLAPWQAPATGRELLNAALAQGHDLRALLHPLWARLRGEPAPLLLIGAPIPDRFSGADAVMHWQAVRLPSLPKEKAYTRRLRDQKDFARALSMNDRLDWIPTSENWHPDVVENRGRLSHPLRTMRVVLVGTGALGSALADVMVRMGLHDLVLVDPQRYEAGNGVRHRLTLAEVGYEKAPALADRLNASNPSARVRGYASALPTAQPDVATALAAADLVLDCTADDALLRALPRLGLRADAHVVSASVGLHAERLYLFADRADGFTAEAFDAWFGPYREREHARSVAEGLPQAAGCWHPVTPVPYHRLLGHVASLAQRLEMLVAADSAGQTAEVFGLDDASETRVAA